MFKTIFVLLFIFSRLLCSTKGLYEFGELLIPAKNAHSSNVMAGLTIYSTENTRIQKETETEFNKSKYILKSKNSSGDTSQAAMVVIDHLRYLWN